MTTVKSLPSYLLEYILSHVVEDVCRWRLVSKQFSTMSKSYMAKQLPTDTAEDDDVKLNEALMAAAEDGDLEV